MKTSKKLVRKSSDFVTSDHARVGLTAADIERAFLDNLFLPLAGHRDAARLALSVRDRLLRHCVETAAVEKGGRNFRELLLLTVSLSSKRSFASRHDADFGADLP